MTICNVCTYVVLSGTGAYIMNIVYQKCIFKLCSRCQLSHLHQQLGAAPPDPHNWDCLPPLSRTPLLKILRTGLKKENTQYWDTTVLIDLLWFNVVYYISLFQYFFNLQWSLTLVENSYFFCTFLLTFFRNTIIIMIEIRTIQGWIRGTSKGSMDFLPVTDP